MQLPHRPPLSNDEVELIRARTRQTNIVTWLTSLNLGLLFLLIAVPACVLCSGCLLVLVMTGAVAVSLPTVP